MHTQTTDGNSVRTTFTTSTTNLPTQPNQSNQQTDNQQQGEQNPQPAPHSQPHISFGIPPQQQQQQQQQQQPPVGVHVVVHATPGDLETLPGRIAAFQQTMAQSGQTNVTIQQAGAQPQVQPQMNQQAPAPGGAPFSAQGLGQGIGMIINQTLQQGAAGLAAQLQGVQQQPATTAPTSTPPAAAPRPNSSDAVDMSAKDLVKELVSKVTTKIPLPMLLQVLGGNISCFDILEDDAIEAIMSQFQHRDTEANRAKLAGLFANEIVERMRSEGITQQLTTMTKSSEGIDSIISDTQAIVNLHSRRVIEVILDKQTRQGASFSEAVSSSLKQLVGHFVDRIQKFCNSGVTDALTLCDLIFRSGSNNPMMAMLGPQFIKDAAEKAFRSYKNGEVDDAAAELSYLPPVANSHLSCLTPGEQVRLGMVENISVPEDLSYIGVFDHE